MNCELFVKKAEFDKLDNRLSGYAPIALVQNMKTDIDDLIHKEDFNIIAQEMDYLKKDFGRLITKDEVMTRMGVFSSDLTSKLQERPTIAYFKKVLMTYDKKIEFFNMVLNDQMDKLDTT